MILSNPDLPATSDVVRTELPNGLVVLTLETHASPIVSTMIWYGVGSVDESAGQTGMSHFLEHMMFKGTPRFPKGALDLLTHRNGGSNNAFTSHDFTAYYFTFASDRWSIALDLEADRMVACELNPSEFESEKKVIIEELKSGLDSPWGILTQELSAQAFRLHPYRNPVVGWLPDLEAATVEQQRDYYERHYRPDNAKVVLVGDFDTEKTLRRIHELFGPIRRRSDAPARSDHLEEDQRGERRLKVRWRSKVPRLAIAYHVPAIGHPDTYALHLLSLVLTEGKASRLYQRLVERDQSVTFVTAEMNESRYPSLLHLRAEGRGDAGYEQIETALYQELDRLARDGPAESELQRAKHQIEAHFVLSHDRTLDQAMLLGQIATLQDLSYVDTYLSRIGSVGVSDVARVCSQYLSEDNRTVAQLVGSEDADIEGDEDGDDIASP